MVTATKVMRAARRSNQSPPPPAAPCGVTASARDAGVANQAPSLRCVNSAASSPENIEPPPSPHPQMERTERWSYDVDKKRRFKLCRIEGCTNRSRKGGVCYLHGAQRKLCKVEGCAKPSVNGGVCYRHGAQRKLCKVEGCANRSKKGGVCYRHGAERKLCEVEGCTHQSHIGGACYRHVAQPKLCEVEGCANRSKKGGVCYRHRAERKLCEVEGCTNQSHIGGACDRHGAQRKRQLCKVEGYTEQSYIGGACSRHVARGSPCSVKGCVSQKKKGGVRDRHGATSRLCAFGGCANNICGNGGVFCNMHHRHCDLDLHGLATKEAAPGFIPGGECGPEEGRRTVPGRFGRGVHSRDGGDDDAALATRTRRIIDAATAAANFANVDPTDPRLVGLIRMHRRTALSRAALQAIRAPREPSADPDGARGGATTGAADRPPSAPPPERGEAAARRGETAAPGVLRFRRILRSLRRVGFANRLANIRALALSGGDAGGAIQILLGRALTTVPSGVEDSEPGDGDHPSASATWRRRGGIHDEGVPEHDRECATTSRTRASLPDEQWFLHKLYAMLEYVVDTEHASAVSWINGGRAFAILDRVAFCEHVVPMFFRQTNFDSFTRQLNMWGFQRVLGKGPAIAAWRHKRFVRGKMEGLHLSRMRGPRAARRNRSPVMAIIPPR